MLRTARTSHVVNHNIPTRSGILTLQGGEDVKEAIRLRDSDHAIEDLTQRLTEMNDQIRGWRNEFDVESPSQLRGTIVDQVLDVTEEDRRREIARE